MMFPKCAACKALQREPGSDYCTSCLEQMSAYDQYPKSHVKRLDHGTEKCFNAGCRCQKCVEYYGPLPDPLTEFERDEYRNSLAKMIEDLEN